MRVAAIDCGTNSIRLLIADISGNSFREILRTMEIVRLGQGVDKTGEFHPEAIARTLSAVDTFAREIARRGVERIRFCATSATRDATNRDLFINGVKERLGITPEVIPGSEEAALSFLGATRELVGQTPPYLVIDIGGGSTEFVLGNQEVTHAKSVDIGCVRMSERHFRSDPPSASEIAAVGADIDSAIALASTLVPIREAKVVIAVAGTATTVAAAALGLIEYDRYAIHLSQISYEKVREVSDYFLSLDRESRSRLGYMHPGRVDVIAAGSLILRKALEATGADSYIASEADILDGIAWRMSE